MRRHSSGSVVLSLMGIESQPNARGAEQCTSTAWSCRPREHGWGWHMCQWASLFKMPFLCALLTYGHGNWNEGISVMDRSIRLQHAMELAPWRTWFFSGVTKKNTTHLLLWWTRCKGSIQLLNYWISSTVLQELTTVCLHEGRIKFPFTVILNGTTL